MEGPPSDATQEEPQKLAFSSILSVIEMQPARKSAARNGLHVSRDIPTISEMFFWSRKSHEAQH
jgi:hypothetical protein